MNIKLLALVSVSLFTVPYASALSGPLIHAGSSQGPEDAFNACDLDANGALDPFEYEDCGLHLAYPFEVVDANQDGFVSLEEYFAVFWA